MPSYVDSGQLVIFTPRNIFNFLAVCFCFVVGWLYIFSPWYISYGLVLGLLLLSLIFSYPLVGLYLFLAVVYLRPMEYYPLLRSISLTRDVAIITLIAFAANMVFGHKQFIRCKQNRYLLWLTLVMLISSILSEWPDISLGSSIEAIKIFLTYLIVINLVDTRKKVFYIIWFYILINYFVMGQYIWQYLTGYGYVDGRLSGLTRGFLANADEIGITLIVSLPLVVAHFLTAKNIFTRLFLAMGGFLFFVATLLTKSRGSLLGMFLVFILLLFIYRSQLKKVQTYQIILLLLLAAFALFRFRMTIIGLLDKTTNFADQAVTGRFDAWRSARIMVQTHPLFGVGLGNFISYWSSYLPIGSWGQIQVAHNIVMEVASQTGLIGLLCYFLYSGQCLLDWRKVLSRKEAVTKDDFYLLTVLRCLVVSIWGFYFSGMFITIGFYWHIFLLTAFFVAAERSLWQTVEVSAWQK